MNERIENIPKIKRSIEAAEAEIKRLSAERERLLELYNTLDLPVLFEGLVKRIMGVVDHNGFMISLANEEQQHLVCECLQLPKGFEELQTTFSRFRFPFDGSDETIRAYRDRQVIRLHKDNLGGVSVYTQSAFFNWRLESMVLLPIVVRLDNTEEVCLGTLSVFRSKGDFSDDDLNALRECIDEYAAPIRNAQYFQRLEIKERYLAHAQEEQYRFLDFITKVNALTRPESIFGLISEEFLHRFPFQIVGVLLKENDRLEVKHIQGGSGVSEDMINALRDVYRNNPYKLKNGDGASSTALLQNSPFYIDDVKEIISLPMSKRDRAGLETLVDSRTFGIVPIRQQDEAIGVLWLVSLGTKALLKDAEKNLIEALCGFIGRAIANTQLYALVESQKVKIEALNQRLQEKVVALNEAAAKDKLTGLFNFGSFQKEINRRMSETARDSDKEALSLVLFDVDHFKSFNDTYGHLAGNEVLKEVAERIRSVARAMDVPCRYGGEEFVVILPRCDLKGAEALADRIRMRVAEVPFFADGKSIDVTISAGCATFRPGESADALIDRADKALYSAKAHGRNRVEIEQGF